MRIPTLFVLILMFAFGPAWAEPIWPPKSFSCYYGEVNDEIVKALGGFELLVVHPENLTPDKVEQLRSGGVKKTVIGYISVGESESSPGGAPQRGAQEKGPSFVSSRGLEFGLAQNGYPSYFVDQLAYEFAEDGFLVFGADGKPKQRAGQDGHPDENGVWGSYYVNPGDQEWENLVLARLKEIDALGVDGFFLDTIDTASPWGDYGWTADGMLRLVSKIRQAYPDKKIVANRGLFYFDSNNRYAELIDAVLFESLLTEYQERLHRAVITPWASGHVLSLDNGVVPAQKKNGMHLLVLDYLNPEQKDAAVLVQSMRTLLKDTKYSLSFSHPALQIPGWTGEDLLASPPPAEWPSVVGMTFAETSKPGQFTVDVAFDGPVPRFALGDLRVTSKDDVKPEKAAQLPLTEILSFEVKDQSVRVTAAGLDAGRPYQVFFRLVSDSKVLASPFAWTRVLTKPSNLPSQVVELSSRSDASGLLIDFNLPDQSSDRFRVYRRRAGGSVLIQEAEKPPISLPVPIAEPVELFVVGVNGEGGEGYPSEIHAAVRTDVTSPPAPGLPKVDDSSVRWESVPEARSYRLYVVPEKMTFRLPLICQEPQAQLENVKPGRYKIFVTSVDDSGNQSRPGPSVEWSVP